ncbi:unnamed protein product [Caretta caretta]
MGCLELQVQDLTIFLAKREKEALSNQTQQTESQAAIRELLKELSSKESRPADHLECQHELRRLRKKLEKTQSLLRAVSKAPVCGGESSRNGHDNSSPVSEEEYIRAPLKAAKPMALPTAPPQETCEEGKSLPVAPVTTTVVSFGLDAKRPAETRQDIKAYTPDQARAMGKAQGPLTKETALDWLAKVCALPNVIKEDVASLVRKCMSGEDFGALPTYLQVADVPTCVKVYEGVRKFYYPSQSIIGLYYSEHQWSGECPEKYLSRKKLLYWLVGAETCNTPQFMEAAFQGLTLTMRIPLGPTDPANIFLQELEEKVRIAYELQREAFPIALKKWVSIVTGKRKEFPKSSRHKTENL